MKLLAILHVIALIEGNDPRALGLHGEVSKYQLTPIAIQEVNDRFKTNYTSRMIAIDDVHAKDCAFKYLLILQRFYDCDTEEKLVRGYNGGPRGWRKSSTESYWKKYQKLKREL